MTRVRLLGVMVDSVTLTQARDRVLGWVDAGDSSCRYVVTPNLDHAVLLRSRTDFRDAYAKAALVIADGMPMLWSSRLTGAGLQERVAGSDLVPAVLSPPNTRRPLTVYLLGAGPGIAERAAANIHARFEHTKVVGTFCPKLGFEHRPAENQAIVERINEVSPDILVIGLGAPKQELWIHKHAPTLRTRVAICAGATIDFLAGHQRRAPAWMQRGGVEWLYRALSQPRRLIPRYTKDAMHLLPLLFEDWRAARTKDAQ